MLKIVVLPLALAVAATALAQDVSPLEVRNLRGLSLPFLRLNPREAILKSGQDSWTSQFTVSNNDRFLGNKFRHVAEDYELELLSLRYRHGLGNGYDMSAEMPYMARGAGFMDPFIAFWHRSIIVFHSTFREDWPLGRAIIDIPGHKRYGGASGIGDISLAISKQLAPAFIATASAKLPTGDSTVLFGSGAVDYGAAIQWHRKIGPRWDFHAQAGYVVQGNSRELPEARSGVWQGAWTFVYAKNRYDSVIGQWQAEPSALVTRVQDSDDLHTMLSLAYRHTIDPGRYWEGYLSEDGDWVGYKFKWFVNVAPDLTLGVRYIQRF